MTKLDTLVITATLGNRSSLSKTIDSVKAHGGNRVRHIIICPQDCIDNLTMLYPEVQIIPEPQNVKGIYGVLNYGLNKYGKNHKYLTYLNDDDYWLPDFKEFFLILDTELECEVVYGRTVFVTKDDKVIKEQASSPQYKVFKELLKQNIPLFTQQATLMRSEVFFNIGGFDENYKLIADTKFWIEVIEGGTKLKYKNVVAAAYTLQENQLSSDKETQRNEHQRLFNEAIFKDVSLFNSLKEKMIFRLTNFNIYYKNFKLS